MILIVQNYYLVLSFLLRESLLLQIFYQLQRGLQSKVNTEELKNDIITFLWDSAFWTKNAANFGEYFKPCFCFQNYY